MKKLTLFAVACMLTAFSFAQNAGQWSFGAGGDFTSPNADANIGYFVMDGMMLSFDFNMAMDYDVEHEMEDGTMHVHEEEGTLDWGMGLRYYAVDNFFFEGSMRTGSGDDLDMVAAAGVSLELAFDGKLWFEPTVQLTMPGVEYGVPNTLGLAWQFRYTF